MGKGTMKTVIGIWLLVAMLQVCTRAQEEDLLTSVENLAIQVPNALERVNPFAVSMQDDHLFFAVKYALRSGGGKGFLYKRNSSNDWERVLTVTHEEGFRDFGDSIHLDMEKKWLFMGLDDHNRDLLTGTKPTCGPSDLKCGHIKENGSYEIVGEPQRIDGDESSDLFGFHIDHFGDHLIITALTRIEVYDLSSGTPVRKQILNTMDTRPEEFDLSEAEMKIRKCEINERLIACGVSTESFFVLTNFPPSYIADPWVVIYELNEETNMYNWKMNIHYRDLFPDGNHWFQMERVHVGLDKTSDTLAIGLPSRGFEQYHELDNTGSPVYDSDGNPTIVNVDFDNGRTAIVEFDDTEPRGYRFQEIEMLTDVDPDYTYWGYSVSCDNSVCLSCTWSFGEPSCYSITKNDDGVWEITTRLRKQEDPNDATVGQMFGLEAMLRQGRAVITDNLHVNVYDDVFTYNAVGRVIESTDEWCFGAESEVEVKKAGSTVIEKLPLELVAVGDLVASVDRRGHKVFSEVFLTQHDDDNLYRPVLRISYESDSDQLKTITVTRQHMLNVPSEDSFSQVLVAAHKIQVGSTIYVMNDFGARSAAVVVAISESTSRIRNVHTMNDMIIVDSVVASCFAELPALVPIGGNVLATVESILISPLKLLHQLGADRLVKLLDSTLHHAASYVSKL